MLTYVSIKGLNKADVLAALYNASMTGKMGFLAYMAKPMTREEAGALLSKSDYFSYIKGRVMKVQFADDAVEVMFYDRDNGPGAAAKVIDELRRTGNVNAGGMQAKHRDATGREFNALRDRQVQSNGQTPPWVPENAQVFRLGHTEETWAMVEARATSEINKWNLN